MVVRAYELLNCGQCVGLWFGIMACQRTLVPDTCATPSRCLFFVRAYMIWVLKVALLIVILVFGQ